MDKWGGYSASFIFLIIYNCLRTQKKDWKCKCIMVIFSILKFDIIYGENISEKRANKNKLQAFMENDDW